MIDSQGPTPSSSESAQPLGPPDGIVSRPEGQLHDFPLAVRWEVTRRHPYYLTCWEWARRYRRPTPDAHPAQVHLDFLGLRILGAIGVTGDPVAPKTPFAELSAGGADPAFLSGSVQPVTLRAVAAMLLNLLPAAERAVVGAILLSSGSAEYHDEAGSPPDFARRAHSLGKLAGIVSGPLDSCPDSPLFYVHLGASQRSIVRDMEDQARLWKAKRGRASSKVHTAKLSDYLRVWDLREGWTGGGYELARELPFRAVAEHVKLSPSTVAGQYRAAFEAVVGHPFSPELWWRVFGPQKFSTLFGNSGASETARHRLHSPTRRLVPDSVLNPEGRGIGVIGSTPVWSDAGVAELVMDIRALLAQNLTDAEVARRLELGGADLVAYVRTRSSDLDRLI